MEFNEKLQQLRKQKGLTQEQLAELLFVSRTAVSKWESGRGYPNLESLKTISKLFSVSIDNLLSGDELIELAKTENRSNISKISGLVFAILDIITVSFLFMPLFGQQEGEYIRAVTLLEHPDIGSTLLVLYFIFLTVVPAFGVFALIKPTGYFDRKICSVILYAAAILLFAVSRQPYITAFLFLLFMVKVVLLIQENRSR